MLRELQRVLQNLLVDLEGVFCVFSERDEPCHKFVENYSQRPQVNGVGITLTCEGFRRHVVGGANHREGFFSPVQFFASSQIDEFKIPVGTNHDVFRF